MSVDSTGWDETIPTNADLMSDVDDYLRAIKSKLRSGLALEHFWPSTQTATADGGRHTFITFQAQTAAPSLPVVQGTTQVGALFVTGAGNLVFEDSAAGSYVVVYSGKGILLLGGTGTIGSLVYATSGGAMAELAASSGVNSILACNAASTAPSYKALTSILVISSGQANHGATIGLPSGVNSNEVQGIMVGIAASTSAFGTSNPDGIATSCSADASRVITARWFSINGGGTPNGTCVANYVVFGVVTH